MTGGRRRPYTKRGILRVPCARCGEPSRFQWNVCADGNRYRGVCLACDVALNDLVLRWMGDPEADAKIAAYRERLIP
jgi:hypothetical protein